MSASNSRRSNDRGYWVVGGRRKPAEFEARNFVLDIAEPEFLSATAKKTILATAVLVVIAAAVSLGVFLSKGTSSDEAGTPSVASPLGASSPPTSMTSSTRPSAAPSSSAVNEFMTGLPTYSLELALGTAGSPQAKALAWLRGDPLYNEYELHRLYQRYALAVFYFSTNGESWKQDWGWLSNDTECSWYMYYNYDIHQDAICDDASTLAMFSLMDNGLEGSMPTEVELLTDLTKLSLTGSNSLGIVPELYVT
jgi:hypothetical protein